MPKSNWKESWWIRRIIYAVLALGLTIAVGGGWITDTQADTWLAQADNIISILAAVGLGIAATKTHHGSDDPTTVRDVTEVAKASTPLPGAPGDLGMVLNDVRDMLAGLGSSAPEVSKVAELPGDYTLLLKR